MPSAWNVHIWDCCRHRDLQYARALVLCFLRTDIVVSFGPEYICRAITAAIDAMPTVMWMPMLAWILSLPINNEQIGPGASQIGLMTKKTNLRQFIISIRF